MRRDNDTRILVRWCAFLFCVVGFFPSLEAAEFQPFGHLELLQAYSGVKRGNSVLGYDINGYYCPTVKFNNSLYLIPVYSVQYEKIRQYLPEEQGYHLANIYLVHNLSVALRKEFRPGWFVKLTVLGTWNYLKETRDEAWAKGLYDYRDAGGAIDLRHKVKESTRQEDYTAGVEWYRRVYPNYFTLLSTASPTAPERREKDYLGYKYRLGFERANADGSEVYLKPYLLIKYFTDKYLVQEDGVLDPSKRRRDYVISLDCGGKLPLTENISFLLDNNYTFNRSNLGYYDSRDTTALSDDVYTKHYYTCHEYTLGPALEYQYSLDEEKQVKVKIGYSFLDRFYPERKVQTEDSTYSNKKERDSEHAATAQFSWPLTKNIDALARYSYTWARSNYNYQQYYRYRYDSYRIEAGLAVDF